MRGAVDRDTLQNEARARCQVGRGDGDIFKHWLAQGRVTTGLISSHACTRVNTHTWLRLEAQCAHGAVGVSASGPRLPHLRSGLLGCAMNTKGQDVVTVPSHQESRALPRAPPLPCPQPTPSPTVHPLLPQPCSLSALPSVTGGLDVALPLPPGSPPSLPSRSPPLRVLQTCFRPHPCPPLASFCAPSSRQARTYVAFLTAFPNLQLSDDMATAVSPNIQT